MEKDRELALYKTAEPITLSQTELRIGEDLYSDPIGLEMGRANSSGLAEELTKGNVTSRPTVANIYKSSHKELTSENPWFRGNIPEGVYALRERIQSTNNCTWSVTSSHDPETVSAVINTLLWRQRVPHLGRFC